MRDSLPMKNPVGTWQWGKNMLLAKGYDSITNEDGLKFEYLVNGTILGVIATTKDIVYLSKNSDGTDEIGVVNINTATYTTKIKSALFNFQYNCPIEGIFIYNYKNELIVAWSDGVKSNSNTPKIVNITNPPLSLNGDGTLVTPAEFTKLNIFPNLKEASIQLDYLTSGAIDGYSAFLTYAYVFNDGSSTPYFASNSLAFLGKGFDPIDKKGVRLTLTDLDPNFDKIKVGLVVKRIGGLFGYESYIINYTGTSKVVDIVSLTNYTTTSPENIIIEKSIFTKINSITKYENQAILGNVSTADPIKFQKYANLLTLKPYRYIATDPQVPTMLPDEVYALYIQLQLLDGSYSEAFHLPGSAPTGTDTDVLTAQQIIDYRLQWTALTEAGDFKQFHIINKGLISTNVATDKFGYWENEEVYPNKTDYDSRTDYNNIALGGTDLRGTPIRYHRMPSIKSSFDNGERDLAQGLYQEDDTFYKIGIMVSDFGTIVPQSVKDKIQGYRLCFVKRDSGNSYVAGNWIITERSNQEWMQGAESTNWEYHDFKIGGKDFTKGRVLSNELYKFKPTLDITYLRANYFLANSIGAFLGIDDNLSICKVKNNIKYVPGNNIAANTLYFEEGINIDLAIGAYINDVTGLWVLNATAFSHKTNLYSGFKSNKFIVLGKTTDLGNEVRFKGGDVFNETEIKVGLHSAYVDGSVIKQKQTNLRIKGLFSPVNNSQLFNTQSIDNTRVIIGDNGTPDNVKSEYYNTRDYDFEVKHEEALSTVNDINTILSFDFNEVFINKFPYRVQRGIKIPNENLSAAALRTYLTSDYYEMPNDKGEIIAVRGKEKALFIQHRFSLFVASVKDKLQTQNIDAFLGRGEVFDRPPEEIISDDKGYIGSSSKFACVIIKGMYITVNQANGQIFIIKDSTNEISAKGNKNWFWNNWNNGLAFYELDDNGEKRPIDNPYISVGHLVGYDKEYNRLLFTKKFYEFIRPDLLGVTITFDGEFYVLGGLKLEYSNALYFTNKSRTLSYSLDNEAWAFEHDYFPNIIFHTHEDLYSITNKLNGNNRASVYKHNDKLTKGLYYGTKFSSYVDLIFNQQLEVSKLYQSIKWVTDVINNAGGNEAFKTITHAIIYNNNQCSGVIDLKNNHFEATRNALGEWHLNDFRDLVLIPNNPIINEAGELISSNINNVKLWFEKSNFISKFITVRLIVDNIDNDTVHIHQVNVQSVISK